MKLPEFDFRPHPRTAGLLKAFAALGGLTLLGGALLAPQRVWPNLLLVSFYVLGLGLAGLFFVALQYITGASWCVAFRRVPEAMTAALPAGAAGLALVLVFRPSLYAWVSEAGGAGFRHAWLNLPFFVARTAVYLLLWIALGYGIVRASRRQDRDGEPRHTHDNARRSAIFLVIFAVTFWLASFDWIMSLEPHWYSTVFGVYNFAGLFCGGLAALILLALWLRRGPLADFFNEEHLHDLGKLLFAFSTFWMYIWFCQYMLIWYANIPEETAYYIRRQHRFWGPLFVLNMLLNWAVPFLVLLSKRSKRDPAILGKVCIVVLVGRWLDLYLMILPPFLGERPAIGIWELGMALGAFGVFVLAFLWALRQAPVVPVGDPFLTESLHYHN